MMHMHVYRPGATWEHWYCINLQGKRNKLYKQCHYGRGFGILEFSEADKRLEKERTVRPTRNLKTLLWLDT